VPNGTTATGDYRIWGTNGSLSASTVLSVTGFDDTEDPTETPTATATEPVQDATPEASPEVTEETATDVPVATETPVLVPTEETPTETPTIEVPTETTVPTEVPTLAPEPITVELVAIADTSVTFTDPDAQQSAESTGVLVAGGSDSAVAYISFTVTGVGTGSVVEATLVLTGTDGGQSMPVGLLAGYLVDEAGTPLTLPTQGIDAAWTLYGDVSTIPTLGAGEQVDVDVTRSIQADGSYTFVLVGDADHLLAVSSREGAAPPKLILVVQP
jgi:hypothetical protein